MAVKTTPKFFSLNYSKMVELLLFDLILLISINVFLLFSSWQFTDKEHGSKMTKRKWKPDVVTPAVFTVSPPVVVGVLQSGT